MTEYWQKDAGRKNFADVCKEISKGIYFGWNMVY